MGRPHLSLQNKQPTNQCFTMGGRSFTPTEIGVACDRLSETGQRPSTASNHLASVASSALVSAPAKTYSTGLGPASVPPKSAGSSTTSNQTAPNLLYNSTFALFFNQERSHKIVLLFILRMNNDTTPSIAACGVRHKTDFMSKIIKIKSQGIQTSIRIKTSLQNGPVHSNQGRE